MKWAILLVAASVAAFPVRAEETETEQKLGLVTGSSQGTAAGGASSGTASGLQVGGLARGAIAQSLDLSAMGILSVTATTNTASSGTK